jgi:hypothetical protein
VFNVTAAGLVRSAKTHSLTALTGLSESTGLLVVVPSLAGQKRDGLAVPPMSRHESHSPCRGLRAPARAALLQARQLMVYAMFLSRWWASSGGEECRSEC